VVLADGSQHERVYVQDAQSYIAVWGVWPEDDSGKGSIDIASVVEIRESRDRLPARFARTVYESGESGMGYTVFTLIFLDGTSAAYVAGGAADFVTFPPKKSGRDVRSVVPHHGRDENPRHDAGYVWCLYGSGESTSRSQHWER
jgi:hypothetical protein